MLELLDPIVRDAGRPLVGDPLTGTAHYYNAMCQFVGVSKLNHQDPGHQGFVRGGLIRRLIPNPGVLESGR